MTRHGGGAIVGESKLELSSYSIISVFLLLCSVLFCFVCHEKEPDWISHKHFWMTFSWLYLYFDSQFVWLLLLFTH